MSIIFCNAANEQSINTNFLIGMLTFHVSIIAFLIPLSIQLSNNLAEKYKLKEIVRLVKGSRLFTIMNLFNIGLTISLLIQYIFSNCCVNVIMTFVSLGVFVYCLIESGIYVFEIIKMSNAKRFWGVIKSRYLKSLNTVDYKNAVLQIHAFACVVEYEYVDSQQKKEQKL